MVLSAREESAEKILNSRWESSSQLSTFYIGCSKFTSHALWLAQRWKIKGREKRDFSDYNQWSVQWVNPKIISDDRLWNLSWFPALVTCRKKLLKRIPINGNSIIFQPDPNSWGVKMVTPQKTTTFLMNKNNIKSQLTKSDLHRSCHFCIWDEDYEEWRHHEDHLS